jgi:hypothetical protein
MTFSICTQKILSKQVQHVAGLLFMFTPSNNLIKSDCKSINKKGLSTLQFDVHIW